MKAHYLTAQHQNKIIDIIFQYISQNRSRSLMQRHSESKRKQLVDILDSICLAISIYEVLSKDHERLSIESAEIKELLSQHQTPLNVIKENDKQNEKHIKELDEKNNYLEVQLEEIKRIRKEGQCLILDFNSSVILRFIYPNALPFSLDSINFKTSQYGYIFNIRVASTNELQHQYLSIFLTLHNGKYCNLLPFPFLHPIHIFLLDQSQQQQHISHILIPDSESPAFSRPTNEKNEEYGIKQFCSLETITDPNNRYVKDGVFFIGVFVDFLNTGQSPFELSKCDTMKNNDMITD